MRAVFTSLPTLAVGITPRAVVGSLKPSEPPEGRFVGRHVTCTLAAMTDRAALLREAP